MVKGWQLRAARLRAEAMLQTSALEQAQREEEQRQAATQAAKEMAATIELLHECESVILEIERDVAMELLPVGAAALKLYVDGLERRNEAYAFLHSVPVNLIGASSHAEMAMQALIMARGMAEERVKFEIEQREVNEWLKRAESRRLGLD